MAIPNKPYTRKEQYLNAMATGDASGIPETPYTREEMYLDTIAKSSGGGGGVLVVTNTDGTLDKTAGEMMTAAETGLVLVKAEPFAGMKSFAVVVQADKTPMGYSFLLYGNTEFAASTESDYPEYVSE